MWLLQAFTLSYFLKGNFIATRHELIANSFVGYTYKHITSYHCGDITCRHISVLRF